MKVELLYGRGYFARKKTERMVSGYVEIYYNRYRFHNAFEPAQLFRRLFI